jgi:hypothetical protein
LLAGCTALAVNGCSSRASRPTSVPAGQPPTATGSIPAGPTPGGRVNDGPALTGSFSSWIFTRAALQSVLADQSVVRVLSHGKIYVILKGRQRPVTQVKAISTAVFDSFESLQQALRSHTLPEGTGAVMLDLEAWSLTPVSEQQHAFDYYTQAAAAVHGAGLEFIASPGRDLVKTLDPNGKGPIGQRLLSIGLIGSVARTADVVNIQAQGMERDTAAYRSFVQQAATQARLGNPRATITAGLSSNPAGPAVSPEQLSAALQSVRGVVSGFWMNIPGHGPQCPRCKAPAPEVAIAALRASGDTTR